MARPTAMTTLGRRLLGVAFLLVPALLIGLSVAVYDKRFTESTMVTLRTSTAGHEMHKQADVKLRGVVVGEVRDITASGSGATLTLAIKPEMAKRIPADAQARLLPTTIFGARYVSLDPDPGTAPAVPAAVTRPISDGTVITEDRSKNAIELSEVLNNTMRLLNTIKPAELSATLNAMAQALEGRGRQLGDNLVQLNEFLTKFNPELPALTRNFEQLAEFVNNFADLAPDLLQSLNDFTTSTRTVLEQRQNLSSLYQTVTASTGDLDDFLNQNDDNLIALAADSRRTLELMRKYSPTAPCTFRTLADFVPMMEKVLGKGTREHGIHGTAITLQHKGRYVAGRDRPSYRTGGTPRCFSVPFRPGGGTVPRATAAGTKVPGAVTAGGLGMPNSASENDLITQLLAPGLDEVPEGLPDWSSVLVGPIYRGAEVKIK